MANDQAEKTTDLQAQTVDTYPAVLRQRTATHEQTPKSNTTAAGSVLLSPAPPPPPPQKQNVQYAHRLSEDQYQWHHCCSKLMPSVPAEQRLLWRVFSQYIDRAPAQQ